MRTFWEKYRDFKPFSEIEAWGLFRLAAIAEAFGWSLLIGGILFSKFVTPGNSAAMIMAGQIHGTLFLIYIVASAVLAPSLGWSTRRTVFAGLLSVPPYGSIALELWLSHRRRALSLRRLGSLVSYQTLLG